VEKLVRGGELTSQGYLGSGRCHWNISQYTIAHEKTSTLKLYFGCGCHNSGACQLTVPTKLLTIDRVDCLTLASPKSVILATPLLVMRILEDLQSRWMTDGLWLWRYWIPRAMSTIIHTYSMCENGAKRCFYLTTYHPSDGRNLGATKIVKQIPIRA